MKKRTRALLALPALLVVAMAWMPPSTWAAQNEGLLGPPKYYQDGKRIPAPANPPPVYPQKELRRRIGGTTVVAFTLGADGRINSAQVKTSSGNKHLDRAAAESVLKWKSIPLKKDGLPISGAGETEITFVP